MIRLWAAAAAAWAASAWPAPPPVPAAPGEEGWARVGVIVASQRGLGGDRRLRFAYRDGERLEKMLATVGQIDSANLFLFQTEDKAALLSSLAGVGARVEELKRKGRKVFLAFYYTGHGAARNFHFGDGRLPFEEAKEAMGGARADARVYVLDVCYGASFFTEKGFQTAPPVQLQMEMDKSARGEVIISSSSRDEQAYEVKTLGGSIFTSHWIMALRGAGDRNRDGQVTLFEAYNYTYDRTAGYSSETLDRPQHPSFQIDLTGARDVMLARLLRSSSGILFRRCPSGIYNLTDRRRGIQIGELRLPEGEEFSLALEEGTYQVQYLPPRGAARVAELTLTQGGMATVNFSDFRDQSPGDATAKGEDGEEPDMPPTRAAAAPAAASSPNAPALAAGSPDPTGSGPEKTGWSLQWGLAPWAGMTWFRDADLLADLNRAPEVDGYFGLGGRFQAQQTGMAWGADLDMFAAGNWSLGLRLGFGQSGYSRRGEGREPGSSDSSGLFPVRLAWDYNFYRTWFGAYVGRSWGLGRQLFSAQAAASYLARRAEGERTLERTLYQTTVRTRESSNSDGYRLEMGLGYGMALGRSGPVLGLRLSPYLERGNALDDGVGLPSWEKGVSGALTLSVNFTSRGRKP